MLNFMYFFGAIFILGSTMALQGFGPNANLIWELVYPFILSAMFAISIKLQTKTILLVATLFTFGEIMKITAEYFSKSIGWPISLIIAGLVIMSIGYMSFEFNKRFFNKIKTDNPQTANKINTNPQRNKSANYIPLLIGICLLAVLVGAYFFRLAQGPTQTTQPASKSVNTYSASASPLTQTPPNFSTQSALTNTPYFIAVESPACNALTCIVAIKENVIEKITTLNTTNNIQASTNYDVFVCMPNCGTGTTITGWKRKQCLSNPQGILTINLNNNSCY